MTLNKNSIIKIIGGVLGIMAIIIAVTYSDLKANDTKKQIPLSMSGWKTWHGITITEGKKPNECIVNSNGAIPDAAGFLKLDLRFLRNKTLILYFSNTDESHFHHNQMVKLEYNISDTLLRPVNVSLRGEYLPVGDTQPGKGIEFKIPDNFDGKLNFVFYKAELKDFKITAYYK